MSVDHPPQYGVCDRETLLSMSGLAFLEAIRDGRLPQPPIARTMGFHLTEVEAGRVVFTGVTGEHLLNPIGTIHGGFAATLLDSCMACACQTTVGKGAAYTTLEIKVNMVRALLPSTGQVQAVGTVISPGRRVVTAEGRIIGPDGKLYAHGTTTCLVLEGERA